MNVELLSLCDVQFAGLESEWTALEEASQGSFFLSWTWIDAWLASLTDRSALRLIRVTDAGATLALGILGQAPRRRLFDPRCRMLLLNQTGRLSEDRITTEHNGMLVRAGRFVDVWPVIFEHLQRRRGLWQALRISGVSDPEQVRAIDRAAAGCGLWRRLTDRRPYYWVDLDVVRETEGGYLNCLSSNSRYQIRRAFKRYGGPASLRISAATTLEDALQRFDRLASLHTAYWQGRGQPGAFSNDFTRRFHRRLIRNGLCANQIQLVTVSVGEQPIGYLYNFLYRGRVMSYQSGFVYGDDVKRKPGLVCHALAIDHNSRHGASVYDFLMGDSQYKRSLSTRRDHMLWLDIRRPLLRFAIEDRMRGMKAALGVMARRHTAK